METPIIVRPWNRRKDRSAIERWPAPNLPAHWVAAERNGPSQSWAIDRDGELVGRISLRDFAENSAQLGIYLRPDLYSKGLGTAALREFIANVAPVECLRLEVAADNYRAIECYLRTGFTEYDRIGNMIQMRILTPLGKLRNASIRTALSYPVVGDLDR